MKILIALMISINTIFAVDNTHCEQSLDLLVNGEQCLLYRCIERDLSCGKRGYLLSYGRKYCYRFKRKAHKFSKVGKVFIKKTRKCLLKELLENASGMTCSNLKKESIDQHVKCYVEGGYCDLSKKDQFTLFKVLGAALVTKPFYSLKTIKRITKACK